MIDVTVVNRKVRIWLTQHSLEDLDLGLPKYSGNRWLVDLYNQHIWVGQIKLDALGAIDLQQSTPVYEIKDSLLTSFEK